MNQFEILRKIARQNPIAAEYLNSWQSKLGIEIFKMRLENGLTQQELAELAKTTKKTISKIEAGDLGIEKCTYERVFKILKG